MLDKDSEYILWLCKRLIYKYKEDPKILETVETILNKNQAQLSFFKKTHESIDKFLAASIENLSSIRTSYRNSIREANKEFTNTNKDFNELFEELNLHDLIS